MIRGSMVNIYVFFPSNTGTICALKWKLGSPCITSQQGCQDMAYTEKFLGIKKTHLK